MRYMSMILILLSFRGQANAVVARGRKRVVSLAVNVDETSEIHTGTNVACNLQPPVEGRGHSEVAGHVHCPEEGR